MIPGFLQQFFFSKKYHAARHVLFWIAASTAIILLQGESENNFRISATMSLFMMPANFVFTYGLIFWLVPRYLVRAKYREFCGYLILWLLVNQAMLVSINHFIVIPYITGVPTENSDFSFFEYFDWYKSLIGYAIAGSALLIRMFKYWYNEQRQKQQAEKEKLNAELQLLKAQLHPHFLFNTLNNLYSLVYSKSDKAPEMLLRLSGILSYVLYECKSDKVLLSKEINIIKTYIALEKERYGERLDISLSFTGDIENRTIEPMLFQPFVENAFKHGSAEQLGKAWMSIDLSVNQNQLAFKLINSCEIGKINGNMGGIGIANVKKRLELLYPGNHKLNYGLKEEVYIVSVLLELGN